VPRRLVLVIALAACAPTLAAPRTPAHDFDFELGTWTTHVAKLEHPLSGSTSWAQYDGTTVVRPVWGGRANLAELEADGPAGHLELLSLRLYDPAAQRWSLNVASARDGAMSPPSRGRFDGGRGEFESDETYGGRPIRVRFVITELGATRCRFEQAFSADGGKTWEVNWIATDTR
jgi:hypothetical protein